MTYFNHFPYVDKINASEMAETLTNALHVRVTFDGKGARRVFPEPLREPGVVG